MQSLWTAFFLSACFLTGESMELPGSKKMARGKSFKKPPSQENSEPKFNILSRRVELDIKFGDYVSDKTFLDAVMFNESMPVISGKIHLLKDIPQNLMIQIRGYRFTSTNQWLPAFDQGKQNYCSFVKNNKSFVKNILIASDFKECPVKKGVYTITNMVIDEKEFPPGIPDCKFKVDIVFTVEGKKIALIRVFADIVQKDDDDEDD